VACTRAAFGKRLNARGRSLVDLLEREADDPELHDALVAEVNAVADESEQQGRAIIHQAAYSIATLKPEFAAGYLGPFCRGCFVLDAILGKRE
jgi:hypothetical protein